MMRTLIRRSLLRILALIKKEILTILMDKKSRAVLFAPIFVQCIIFVVADYQGISILGDDPH